MTLARARPLFLDRNAPHEPCATCESRPISVCRAIPDDNLARLAEVAETITLARGETLITEGDPATAFFNVTQGTLKLYKGLPDGRQQIMAFAGAGYFLGLAVSSAYGFTAEAIAPARLCRFSRSKLARLMADFPALEHSLLETACNELASAQEQMLLLGRRTARERVACFLLGRLNETVPCQDADCIRLPMTRGEIADYLGLTIETVSRNLSRLKAEKRIALPSLDTVVVLDRAGLETIAEA